MKNNVIKNKSFDLLQSSKPQKALWYDATKIPHFPFPIFHSPFSILQIYLFVILSLTISSCDLVTRKSKEKPLARVFDRYLYPSDIEQTIPPGTPEKDSLKFVQNYINKWVGQTLLLTRAELNLPGSMKNVEKQLDDYRTSLIIYAYERELVHQKLDTLVTMREIEEYYHANKKNFELKDYIVKVLYIKLAKNSPEIQKVKRWCKSAEENDLRLLEEYCRKYALNFFIDVDVWLFFDDLLKEIPIQTINKEDFLKNNKFSELEDKTQLYLLNILDYRLKDDISPLSLEINNIRNIIINKRKLKLVSDLKRDLHQEALDKGNMELYVKTH